MQAGGGRHLLHRLARTRRGALLAVADGRANVDGRRALAAILQNQGGVHFSRHGLEVGDVGRHALPRVDARRCGPRVLVRNWLGSSVSNQVVVGRVTL